MRARIAISLVIVAFFAAWGATAQDRGDLVGTVLDIQGAPLPGVTVYISGPETRRSVADARGEFVFKALVPGRYDLRFELTGFRPAAQAIGIRPATTERVSVRLAVAGMQES